MLLRCTEASYNNFVGLRATASGSGHYVVAAGCWDIYCVRKLSRRCRRCRCRDRHDGRYLPAGIELLRRLSHEGLLLADDLRVHVQLLRCLSHEGLLLADDLRVHVQLLRRLSHESLLLADEMLLRDVTD